MRSLYSALKRRRSARTTTSVSDSAGVDTEPFGDRWDIMLFSFRPTLN